MKLFITNKKEFTESFDDPERFKNTIREMLTSRQIHKDAFNILQKSINIERTIPIGISTNYDCGEGVAIFIFKNKNEDIYFYEYSGTAS